MQNCTVQVLPRDIDTDIVAVYSNGDYSLQLNKEAKNGGFTFPCKFEPGNARNRITFYAFPQSNRFTVTRHIIDLQSDAGASAIINLQDTRLIYILVHVLYIPEDINAIIKEIRDNCKKTQKIWDDNRFGVQIASHDIYIPVEPIDNTSDDDVIYGIELHRYAEEAAERYPEYHHVLYVRSLGNNTRHVGWCANNGKIKYIIMTAGCSGELLCHELGHMHNLTHTHNIGRCGKDMAKDRSNVMSKGASSRTSLTYGQIIRAHFLKNSHLNRTAIIPPEDLLITGNQGCADSHLPPISLNRRENPEDAAMSRLMDEPEDNQTEERGNRLRLREFLSSDCVVEEEQDNDSIESIVSEKTEPILKEIIDGDILKGLRDLELSPEEFSQLPFSIFITHEANINPGLKQIIRNRAQEALNYYKKRG